MSRARGAGVGTRPAPRGWRCIAAAIALAGSGAAFAAPAAETTPPPTVAIELRADSFEVAMNLYESCHWREAYLLLAALADRGDERASRLALLMARHGSRLYGVDLPVDATRAALWARQALAEARRQPPR